MSELPTEAPAELDPAADDPTEVAAPAGDSIPFDPESQYPPFVRTEAEKVRWNMAAQAINDLYDEEQIPLGPGEPSATSADYFTATRALYFSDIPTGPVPVPEGTPGGTVEGTEPTPETAEPAVNSEDAPPAEGTPPADIPPVE